MPSHEAVVGIDEDNSWRVFSAVSGTGGQLSNEAKIGSFVF